jgi:hypothetical protein
MIVNRKPPRSMVVICWLAAFLGAMVLVVGWRTTPASASAPSYGDGLYLENSDTFGLYAKSGVTQGSQVAITNGGWGGWVVYDEGPWTADGISGEGFEFASVRTSGEVSDLCMAATSPSAYIYLEPCGANGTVWVATYSNGGFILYSRYYLDQGAQALLATYPKNGYDAFLTINPVTNPAIFRRWLDTYGDLY